MYSFERLLCVPVADSKCPTLHRDMTKVGEGWRFKDEFVMDVIVHYGIYNENPIDIQPGCTA